MFTSVLLRLLPLRKKTANQQRVAEMRDTDVTLKDNSYDYVWNYLTIKIGDNEPLNKI